MKSRRMHLKESISMRAAEKHQLQQTAIKKFIEVMAVKPLLSLLFDEEKDQINKTWELKYVFQHSP